MSALGEAPPRLRPGREADAQACAAIEAACLRQFADSPHPWVVDLPSPPPAEHARAASLGRLEVAELHGRPVGFTILEPDEAAGALHVVELDVDPRFQRRGLARALLERAAEQALRRGLSALSLTTFGSVVWNAPLYRRLGFERLEAPDWTPACRAEIASFAARGLPTTDRVAMLRRLR